MTFPKNLAVRTVRRAVISKADLANDGFFVSRLRHVYVAGYDVVEMDGDGKGVKTVLSHEGFDMDDAGTLAFVKLAAAAPDLLAAARQALSILERHPEHSEVAKRLEGAVRQAEEGRFVD